MSSVTAKICVHETSQPLSNVLITWYTTSEFSIPEEIAHSGPEKWEELSRTNWKGFNVTRIGSASTKDDGIAHFLYGTETTDGGTQRPSNLWYTLQFPEVIGTPNCGHIFHVASCITVNGANHEEFVLRIPVNIIERHQITTMVSPTIDSKRSSEDVYVQLQKIEHGSSGSLEPGRVAFSKQFNQAIVKAKQHQIKEFGLPYGPMSFTLNMSVDNSSVTESMKGKISFDRNTKQLVIQSASGNPDTPLAYQGVVRYTHQQLTNRHIKKPHIIIDKDTGKVQLALPKVPDILELSETEPSQLFKQLTGDKSDRMSTSTEGTRHG